MIKKCNQADKDDRPANEQVWCLYTADGKDLLGRRPTKESAEEQERAVYAAMSAEEAAKKASIILKDVIDFMTHEGCD